MIKITQVRSTIGCLPKHRKTIRGLGLHHIGNSVKKIDTPDIRGMINSIIHLVKVEYK